jgi:hypothetical protein
VRPFLILRLLAGDRIKGSVEFKHLLPCPHSSLMPKTLCSCSRYPVDGLLEINGFVSEADMQAWLKEQATEIPVLKHGSTTGTTVGRLNSLKTLVRHYTENLHFDSIEHTFLGFGRHAFSEGGDSGASIVDREGRLVAMITSGSGGKHSMELTFATPYYKIFDRIEEVLPGYTLYPPLLR